MNIDDLLSDVGSLFQLATEGINTLLDYVTSGIQFIISLLKFVPVELYGFMTSALFLSVLLLILGRSDNH